MKPPRAVPLSVPRLPNDNHMQEWIQACKGGPATYNGFEIGARVSEAYLPGMLSLRLGPAHRVGQRPHEGSRGA